MSVLDDILAGVREDLELRKLAVPLAQLQERAAGQEPARDAWAALGGNDSPRATLAVIAEIKRRSPSKGELAQIADPAALAQEYADGGAAVVSVLTEQRRFGGSLADLDAVRAAVDVPVLRKDFTVDAYQIWEARAHGADLVLLIAAALSDDQLTEFLELTHRLGMNALLETHTKDEVHRAVAAGARIIGVNVRNLKTLDVDRTVFAPLASLISSGALVVAESGVRDADDVSSYAASGANAILVGEALVSDATPRERIAQFTAAGAAARKNADAGPAAADDGHAAVAVAANAAADDGPADAFLSGAGSAGAARGTPSLRHAPGPYFGAYGGRWMPESLIAALDELEDTFEKAKADPEFLAEVAELNKNYSGRPSLLTEAKRFSAHAGGARIFLKREDLNHTGSHKINNVLGQALLAKRMGKTRVIAETGAGQHGVASATAAALLGLECVVYMGAEDCRRQSLNVARMELLGATVVPVTNGSQTLKDAINDALRDWVANVDSTHYLLGTAAGAHPFPAMVRFFHEVIGEEARGQILAQTGRLPDAVCACIGGGSNAIGIFHGFLDDPAVQIFGFEAGGDGVETGRHAATITLGRPGVLHGARSYLMQDEDGQTVESHSISAGLDYPGVGPEHSYLADIGRVSYEPITDAEAMEAFRLLCRTEGIIPAIESAHALAGTIKVGQRLTAGKDNPQETIIVVNLSGRGDKDVATAAEWFNLLDEQSAEAAIGKEGEQL
ncbi:tryptophan synthase subunit beta [Paenarthrobacter sp. Z7-10]|nr:tryptophan synthase subunit beta [Paenarthrobacter sp. Z7-10]